MWCLAGAPAISFLVLAFFPRALLARLIRGTGRAAALAVVAVFALWALGNSDEFLWNDSSRNPLTIATFRATRTVVSLFVPHVDVEPAIFRIGTPAFHVRVLSVCSGIEGLSLMLVLTLAWLYAFRREFRFPQSLLLVPLALSVTWFANVLRIAALVLIGNAGHPEIAMSGFHSSAGWIAFSAISVAFLLASQHFPWFTHASRRLPAERNPTAVYLMPFLLIAAAAMVSAAFSAGFESLYPLRLLAAALPLWFFRKEYRIMDWTFTWFAPLAGAFVFVLWIGLDRLLGGGPDGVVEAGLARLSAPLRFVWLASRVVCACLIVPIAEELAFRGYLPRRILAADFESVGFRNLTPLAILLSSLLFGALHGTQWLAAFLAGTVYAMVLKRQGKIGDAVAAHAVTNTLLAAWVIATGAWHLW